MSWWLHQTSSLKLTGANVVRNANGRIFRTDIDGRTCNQGCVLRWAYIDISTLWRLSKVYSLLRTDRSRDSEALVDLVRRKQTRKVFERSFRTVTDCESLQGAYWYDGQIKTFGSRDLVYSEEMVTGPIYALESFDDQGRWSPHVFVRSESRRWMGR